MAADLYIHSAEGLEEEDFQCIFSSTLGSKYFNLNHPCKAKAGCPHSQKLDESSNVWIGEVSWLKANLTGSDAYVPDSVGRINELIDEGRPVLDRTLYAQLAEASDLENKTRYHVGNRKMLEQWLKQHMGEKLFTVTW